MIPTVTTRKTKYCTALQASLQQLGHATNAELLAQLRLAYPTLTATTVHRATSRLAARGEIGIAPSALDGSTRYDASLQPHDHFFCNHCGMLKDADLYTLLAPSIEKQIGDGCRLSGNLVVSGTCKSCTLACS